MNQTLETQELAIVVAAKECNPTILNPDFLKYSGIVPTDWELARQPIYTNQVAQVIFQNGISIVAEPNRVMFLEPMLGKVATEVAVPEMAHKYVETLPNVDYQGVGINLRGHIPFTEQDAAHKYLVETLLSPGPWQDLGQAPARATVSFAYMLERGPLNLSITEAALRLPNETTIPIVLFSGNFSYNFANKADGEQNRSLSQAIENWQADLETFKDIINTKFLASFGFSKAAVPDLFAMSS